MTHETITVALLLTLAASMTWSVASAQKSLPGSALSAPQVLGPTVKPGQGPVVYATTSIKCGSTIYEVSVPGGGSCSTQSPEGGISHRGQLL